MTAAPALDLRAEFARFRAAARGRVHLAAHSHHYWPDVSLVAHEECWRDAALLADHKWERVFGEILPAAQRGVALHLGIDAPHRIAFAPNTHELVMRIWSCLRPGRAVRVLTTDAEFTSFDRQLRRFEEDGAARTTRVSWQPIATFADRFADAARRGHDFVLLSHVAFDTGAAVADLGQIVRAVADRGTIVVIDGYHAFLARPIDLAPIADRAFYVGGGYKYAMAGEGVCFVYAPDGYGLRPRDTGWFAEFTALANPAGGDLVAYPTDAGRFLGATFDPSGLYRLRAVFDWLAKLGLDATAIRAHSHRLQRIFVEELVRLDVGALGPERLAVPLSNPHRGNFLAFAAEDAEGMVATLRSLNIVADARRGRVRFGFGLYHTEDEVREGAAAVADALY